MAELNSNDLAVIQDFITNVAEANEGLAGDLHFNCILQAKPGGVVLGRVSWNEDGDVVFIPPVSD